MADKAAPSAADLEAKKGGMKKVDTKEGTGQDPAALAAMEKVYNDNGGDLGKIASQLKVDFKEGVTVKDSKDFASRFLSGLIVKE